MSELVSKRGRISEKTDCMYAAPMVPREEMLQVQLLSAAPASIQEDDMDW